jgi:hypothetical protein
MTHNISSSFLKIEELRFNNVVLLDNILHISIAEDSALDLLGLAVVDNFLSNFADRELLIIVYNSHMCALLQRRVVIIKDTL